MDELSDRRYPIQEHMRFQRRTWVVERVGWLVLAAITLLALTGALGNGWLSARTAGNGALTVDYERFERETRLAHFTFRFAPGPQGERRLHLNSAFRDHYEISSIQPPPMRSETGSDGLTLIFAAPPSAGAVTLWAHPRRYGISHLEARAGDAAPVTFSVLVYP